MPHPPLPRFMSCSKFSPFLPSTLSPFSLLRASLSLYTHSRSFARSSFLLILSLHYFLIRLRLGWENVLDAITPRWFLFFLFLFLFLIAPSKYFFPPVSDDVCVCVCVSMCVCVCICYLIRFSFSFLSSGKTFRAWSSSVSLSFSHALFLTRSLFTLWLSSHLPPLG